MFVVFQVGSQTFGVRTWAILSIIDRSAVWLTRPGFSKFGKSVFLAKLAKACRWLGWVLQIEFNEELY